MEAADGTAVPQAPRAKPTESVSVKCSVALNQLKEHFIAIAPKDIDHNRNQNSVILLKRGVFYDESTSDTALQISYETSKVVKNIAKDKVKGKTALDGGDLLVISVTRKSDHKRYV